MKDLDRVSVLVPGTDQIYARSVAGKIEVDRDLLPEGLQVADFGSATIATEPLGSIRKDDMADVIGA